MHLPVLVVLFFVGRIHEVGPVVAGVLGWAWTSLWLALSFTTSIAQRHGLGARERLRLALSEKALCFGLGGLVALVPALLLPVLLPGLICGGTKAFLALAAHGSVPSDLDEAARARLLAPRPEGEEGDR